VRLASICRFDAILRSRLSTFRLRPSSLQSAETSRI
jgi:hypothetical protein